MKKHRELFYKLSKKRETCRYLLVVSPSNRRVERKSCRMVGIVDAGQGRPVEVPFTSLSGAIVTGWDDGPSNTPNLHSLPLDILTNDDWAGLRSRHALLN